MQRVPAHVSVNRQAAQSQQEAEGNKKGSGQHERGGSRQGSNRQGNNRQGSRPCSRRSKATCRHRACARWGSSTRGQPTAQDTGTRLGCNHQPRPAVPTPILPVMVSGHKERQVCHGASLRRRWLGAPRIAHSVADGISRPHAQQLWQTWEGTQTALHWLHWLQVLRGQHRTRHKGTLGTSCSIIPAAADWLP